jgi:hypothetical protein
LDEAWSRQARALLMKSRRSTAGAAMAATLAKPHLVSALPIGVVALIFELRQQHASDEAPRVETEGAGAGAGVVRPGSIAVRVADPAVDAVAGVHSQSSLRRRGCAHIWLQTVHR